MNNSKWHVLLILIILLTFIISGCTSLGVNVWERDILASPHMKLEKNAIEREMDDHIYFSKEGSSGGRGFGGGGCGCN